MSKIFLSFATIAWLSILLISDHYLPWVSWHTEAVVNLCAWLALCAAIFYNNKKIVFLPGSVAPIGLFVLLVAGQHYIGMVPTTGDLWVASLYAGLCFAGIIVGSVYLSFRHERAEIRINFTLILATLLIFTAVIFAMEAMLQSLDLWERAYWLSGKSAMRRPGGNLSQPNHLATMLMLGAAAVLYVEKRGVINSRVCEILLIPILIALILTESRTGLLELLIILFWSAYFDGQSKFRWLRLCGIVLVVALGFYVWPYCWNWILMNEGASVRVNLSSSGRLDLWAQTLVMIAERPWMGWGFGRYAQAQNFMASDYAVVLPATYSHNIFLDLCIWFGVPLALLVSGYVIKCTCTIFRKTHNPEDWFFVAILGVLLVHAMLEYPHAYAYFLLPAAVAIGGLDRIFEGWRLRTSVLLGIVVLWGVLLIASAIDYLRIEEDFRVARFQAARVGALPSGYERADTMFLTQLKDVVDVIWMMPQSGMSYDEIEKARRAATLYPWRALISKYATILILNDRATEGFRELAVLRAYFGDGAADQVLQKIRENSKKE